MVVPYSPRVQNGLAGAASGAALVIETRGLGKRFGDLEAVAGIDLRVPAGGVYGFLGPNGSGKTTTIRMLLSLVRASRGSSWLFGEEVTANAPVLQRVGAMVERPAAYPYLTATDNLRVLGMARGIREPRLRTLVPDALERVGLVAAADRKAGRFSTGMRQRLGIAAALLGRPELVILDEPANGLDPAGVIDVRDLIAGLARDGTTVFLSSHVLPEVEALCHRVAILQAGKIVAEGETQAMLLRGTRLYVRFDSANQAAQAEPVLAPFGSIEAVPASAALLLDASQDRASEVARTLADAGLYPAELTERRPTLESVFIELTSEHQAA
jgi:ABC-type multidrug transport system ATPase subunit